MTDEEYTYRQDVAEKKNIARSAYSVARNRGGVKMPSDFLTKEERKKMNGECKTYNLSVPMRWKEFKAMPPDYRREYLVRLDEQFAPSQYDLATMFGVSQKTVSNECVFLRIGGKKKNRKRDRTGFEAFVKKPVEKIAEQDDPKPEAVAVVEVECKPEPEKVDEIPVSEHRGFGMAHAVMEFKAVTPDTLSDILTVLRVCMPTKCRLTICIDEEENHVER